MSAAEEANQAQRAAAEPDASVFVVANAGSGKTKVLIDRVARLLLAGSTPSSILCITYTKAAAAEMQRRLFERLGKWSIAADADLQAELEALGEHDARSTRALSHARRQFARALETPGGLRIQTIHAFCERLLGRFPLEAGAAPGFQILDEAGQKKLLTQARSIAAQEPPVAEALERLCERIDPRTFDGLLQALRARADSLAAAMAQGADAAWLRLLARHGDPPSVAELEAQMLGRAPWAALEDARAILAAAKGPTNAGFAQRIAAALHDRQGLDAYLGIFFNNDGERRGKPPTKEVQTAHPWLMEVLRNEAGRIEDLQAHMRARERAEDSFAALQLGEAVARAYTRLKQFAGALDFDDLIAQTRALLCDRPAAAWVLYKLDGGIDHILLDEGQDTSPEQWALLRPLQDEFFAGEGARAEAQRTVFAVGDPKQSIYSFQGADPAQFLEENQGLAARAEAAGKQFVGATLAVSFRSTPVVLQLVDATFQDAEFAREAAPALFDRVRHVPNRTEQGLVQWWPFAPRPDNTEPRAWDAPLDQEDPSASAVRLGGAIAQTLHTWIREGDGVWTRDGLRPMHAGDVLILVKKRARVFRAVLRALKREGLPVAGADRMVLSEELAVQDLLALARAALDPADDLALACVLKSPLLGLFNDDADLFPLAHGRARDERLFDRLRASTDPRFAPARRLIEAAIARRDASPFTFFSSALEGFGDPGAAGWIRMGERLGPEARDPLEELLARALRAPKDGLHGLWRFVAALEQADASIKREGEDAGEAVRVMTVHGAKGLEAPVVFLAETTLAPDDGPRQGLFFEAGAPVWSASAKHDDALAAELRAAKKRADEQEHQRLLYVALTRARDRLVICAAAPGRGSAPHPGSWHAVTERALRALPETRALDTPFGPGLERGARLPTLTRRSASSGDLALTPPWMSRPAPPAPGPAALTPQRAGFSPRGEGAKRFQRGLLIHGLLQRLPDVAPAQREAVGRAWLTRQGLAAEPAGLLLEEALGVLEHPACAPVFGPGSRAEQPILGDGVRGVIDRLLILPEAVWVIDFKTDRPAPAEWRAVDPAYLEQLGGYVRALRAAFPQRRVHASLIWTEAPRVMAVPEEAWTTPSRARVD